MHIFEVLCKHKFVLAKSLNWLDHVGLKTHAWFGRFGFFEDLFEGGIVFGQQFHDFIGLGVVITVVGVARLEVFLYKEFEDWL